MTTALIVDDSSAARRIIRHHLSKIGCVVVGEADTSAQALRLFPELHPDLVTLDLMMPNPGTLDSLETMRRLRAIDPEVIVIIVSAVPFDKVRETFLRSGALAYLVKPFNQYSFEPIRQKLIRALRARAA